MLDECIWYLWECVWYLGLCVWYLGECIWYLGGMDLVFGRACVGFTTSYHGPVLPLATFLAFLPAHPLYLVG